MPAERPAVVSFNIAFFCGNVIHQKFSEIAFADKTNARAVLFFGGGKPVMLRNFADFGFLRFSKREQDVFQLFLRKILLDIQRKFTYSVPVENY